MPKKNMRARAQIINSYEDLRRVYLNDPKIRKSMSFEDFCDLTRKLQKKMDDIRFLFKKKYVSNIE